MNTSVIVTVTAVISFDDGIEEVFTGTGGDEGSAFSSLMTQTYQHSFEKHLKIKSIVVTNINQFPKQTK